MATITNTVRWTDDKAEALSRRGTREMLTDRATAGAEPGAVVSGGIQRPAGAAVDPHASDPGTPAPREKKS